jgi:hypothetical protein
MTNGGTQMVGAVLGWDPTDLPQRLLDALGERLKGFAETHAHGFDIGVREHQVVQQMGKYLSVHGHMKIAHVGEIRRGPFAGDMDLLKDDFPFGSMLRTPLCNVAL